MTWVGRPLRRREDAPLLAGRGRFVDDLTAPGVAHLALVRSPHAHARVGRLDVGRARHAPGVVTVVSEDRAAVLTALSGMPEWRRHGTWDRIHDASQRLTEVFALGG